MEIHSLIVLITHYGYEAVMELFVDVGDHFVTHYVMIIVLKAGVIHVGWKTVKHVRKRVTFRKE